MLEQDPVRARPHVEREQHRRGGLPKGERYELWFAGPGDRPARPNRISADTCDPDENGRSHVSFAAAVDPALYPVVIVTAEPGDGDPRPSGIEALRTSNP